MRIGNWPLVMLAIEWIIKHPDEHSQSFYRMYVEANDGCGDSDCCEPTDARTVRCLADWIAYFARYTDISRTDYVLDANDEAVLIETAAMIALELDPEIYGTDFREGHYNGEARSLSARLFDGMLTWDNVVEEIRDLAAADGVTPTPLIVADMVSRGLVVPNSWVSGYVPRPGIVLKGKDF